MLEIDGPAHGRFQTCLTDRARGHAHISTFEAVTPSRHAKFAARFDRSRTRDPNIGSIARAAIIDLELIVLDAELGVTAGQQPVSWIEHVAALAPHEDAIVTDCATCGSSLKEYPHWLADDPDYAERAKKFAAKVRDISEFVAEIGIRPPEGKVDARVTYHDPCHLCRAQGVREQPREMLRAAGWLSRRSPPRSRSSGSRPTNSRTVGNRSRCWT